MNPDQIQTQKIRSRETCVITKGGTPNETPDVQGRLDLEQVRATPHINMSSGMDELIWSFWYRNKFESPKKICAPFFTTVTTPICSYFITKTFLPRFYSNSEANASELLQNLEEMFPRYCRS